jgi:DNA-binding transcriptional MerR regulator
MNIQEASQQTGLSPDTIRFYERNGVLPRPPRRANGYRDYAEEHLATLQLVQGLRHLEMSLGEMREVARVAHDATCGELRETLVEQLQGALAQANTRIQELEHARGHIEELLTGLRRMPPTDDRVPGTVPCGCVRLVSAQREE